VFFVPVFFVAVRSLFKARRPAGPAALGQSAQEA
jgi:hypothetical protein